MHGKQMRKFKIELIEITQLNYESCKFKFTYVPMYPGVIFVQFRFKINPSFNQLTAVEVHHGTILFPLCLHGRGICVAIMSWKRWRVEINIQSQKLNWLRATLTDNIIEWRSVIVYDKNIRLGKYGNYIYLRAPKWK